MLKVDDYSLYLDDYISSNDISGNDDNFSKAKEWIASITSNNLFFASQFCVQEKASKASWNWTKAEAKVLEIEMSIYLELCQHFNTSNIHNLINFVTGLSNNFYGSAIVTDKLCLPYYFAATLYLKRHFDDIPTTNVLGLFDIVQTGTTLIPPQVLGKLCELAIIHKLKCGDYIYIILNKKKGTKIATQYCAFDDDYVAVSQLNSTAYACYLFVPFQEQYPSIDAIVLLFKGACCTITAIQVSIQQSQISKKVEKTLRFFDLDNGKVWISFLQSKKLTVYQQYAFIVPERLTMQYQSECKNCTYKIHSFESFDMYIPV